MQQILLIILSTIFVAETTSAATLKDDHLYICDKILNISSKVQPSALMDASATELEAKHFGLVYERFAQLYEATLSPTERAEPTTAKFITNIRRAVGPTSANFEISPDLVGKSEKLFESSEDEIIFNCDKLTTHDADMAAVALMTHWVRKQQLLPEFEKRALFVAQQSKAHEALLYNGLPMWPWELWLNGLRLGTNDSEPLFKTQWVILRPTAGFEINTRNRASGNLDASVGVEPLGLVHYINEDYSSWWGVSLLVTSTTGAGIGLGGLLRWNNYVLGVTRHESSLPSMTGSSFIFVGVELYDFANKKRGNFDTWRTLQKNRVAEVLK